ncbi:hypothetical protein BCR36DRAFT_321391 [Piromyces finnis]|uniref:MYCBP-associated protein n=1 Tax=Piromyces finnis TaxID=1754191 RepID=A0A1Y1VG25_9FUNG|nr:hypothetical protein BCR36DRAFT_321391 [Piromyces finnis]|eukprot:ORX55358.1 hypothetical protein BCR36DRAFT_321391 [Piromyces finnis]
MLANNEIVNNNEDNNDIKPKTILVARHLPTDKNGKDLLLEDPMNKPIPMNAIIKKETGPRRQSNGALIDYSLLGDPDDFEYMDKLYNNNDEEENQNNNNNNQLLKDEDSESSLQNKCNDNDKISTSNYIMSESREDRKKKNHIHIFQKYCEVKERHALENWKRHSIEWSKIEDNIAKKINRDKSQNLNRQLTEFGLKREYYRLFENTYDFLDDKNLPFWRDGLTVGYELLGYHISIPRGGPREIKQIRRKPLSNMDKGNTIPDYLIDKYISQERNIYNPEYLEVVGKHTTLEASELAFDYVQYMSQAFNKKKEDSSVPNGNINEEKEKHSSASISKNNSNSSLESDESVLKSMEIEESSENNSEVKKSIIGNENESIDINGTFLDNSQNSNVSLVFKTDRLVFFSVLNHVVSSILTIYNNGTTAIHFEWRKVQRNNDITKYTKEIRDGIQKFYFYHTTGIILPGSAYDFPIMFKSDKSGIFTESWEMVTSPETPCSKVIEFKGYAIQHDTMKFKRQELEKILEHRKAIVISKSIDKYIFDKVCEQIKNKNAKIKKTRIISLKVMEHQHFIRRNKDYHLNFTTIIIEKLKDLCNRVNDYLNITTEWNRSIDRLYNNIYKIENKEDQSEFLKELNTIISLSVIKVQEPYQSVHYSLGYWLFVELADNVTNTSIKIRGKLELPINSYNHVKFYENIEFKTPEMIEEEKNVNKNDKKKNMPKKAPPAKVKAKVSKKNDADTKSSTPDSDSINQLTQIIDDYPKNWSKERRKKEQIYKLALKRRVRELVVEFVDRWCLLFADVNERSKKYSDYESQSSQV